MSGRLDPLFTAARAAARRLSAADRDGALQAIATQLLDDSAAILEANRLDVAAEAERGTSEALLDRLRLDAGRLEGISAAVRQVAALPDPLQHVKSGWRLP